MAALPTSSENVDRVSHVPITLGSLNHSVRSLRAPHSSCHGRTAHSLGRDSVEMIPISLGRISMEVESPDSCKPSTGR